MKKFLTVLLVIAVMFTFSFGSAMAATDLAKVIDKATALTYAQNAYNKALADLLDAYKAKLGSARFDLNDGSYTTATDSVVVSKANFEKALAANAEYKVLVNAIEAEYTETINAINTAVKNAEATDAGFKGFDTDGDGDEVAGYIAYEEELTFNHELATLTTVEDSDIANFDKEAAILQAKAAKSDAITAVSAIVLEGVYSKEYKNTTESNYDKASDLVKKALEELQAVDAGTAEDVAAAAIDTVADIYTAPTGQAKAAGLLYTGKKIDGTVVAAWNGGLNAIEKLEDAEANATDLAYAQNKVLNFLLGWVSQEKNDVVDIYNGQIRVEREKDTPDADKIAEWTEAIADTEAAYKDAEAAITYLVKATKSVSELGSFVHGVFTVDTTKFNADTQATTYTTFKNMPVRLITTTAGVYIPSIVPGAPNCVLSIGEMMDMAKEVAKAEKLAEADKVYVNLDGSYAVQIEEALEDAIYLIYTTGADAEDAYSTPTNTSELDERKDTLIDSILDFTISGKKYTESVNEWKAYANNGGTFENELNDEIRALVKETKAAIKAAATIAEADAAYVAGYEKLEALNTGAEHLNMFTLKTGALTEKYKEYCAKFVIYAKAYEDTLTQLDKIDDYDVSSDLASVVDYYVGTADNGSAFNGAFYLDVYDEAALDAVYAEAIAAVDNLKTEAEVKAMADAALAAINALPEKITLADKAAVFAAQDAVDEYVDYYDLVNGDNQDLFTVDGKYVRGANKLSLAQDAIDDAEQEAIADLYDKLPATAADTDLEDAAVIEEIRALIDAYVADRVAKDATNEAIEGLYADAIGGAGKLAAFENANGYEDMLGEAKVAAVVDMIAKLAVDPVDAAAVKAAREAMNALPEGYGVDARSYDKLVALEKLVAESFSAKAYLQDLSLKARSVKTKAGNVKVTVVADVDPLLEAGYTVEYKFYRSTKSNKNFKGVKGFSDDTTYTNTKGTKGTKYYYKVVVQAVDAEGNVVAKTPLKHCLYATRTWTK